MEEKYPMTTVGKEKLEKELIYLKEEKLIKINKEVKRLRSFCDFFEDASFTQMLEKQSLIKERIGLIEEMLNNAELIESKENQKSIIAIGSKVSFARLPKGEEETYIIVGRVDADPIKNKISTDSPIGRSLLGSKKGDEINIETPSGKIKVKVTNVF